MRVEVPEGQDIENVEHDHEEDSLLQTTFGASIPCGQHRNGNHHDHNGEQQQFGHGLGIIRMQRCLHAGAAADSSQV
jgi:hypothetical protein